MNNLETLKQAFEKELEEKIKKYKKNVFNKKDIDLLSLVGLDRVEINIPMDKILSQKKEFSIRKDPYFESLRAGYYMKNFYGRLIFNPSKFLWGDNLLNISNGEELEDCLMKLQEYIKKSYDIDIDFMECTLASIEQNKYIKFNHSMEDYSETFSQINKRLAKGHFKKKFNLFKDWGELNYIGFGSKNKYVVWYDKSLEHFIKEYGEDELKKIPPRELKKICKRYKTPVRFEIKLKKSSLWNLIPKTLTLKEFCRDFSSWIEYIQNSVLEEAGLNEKTLEIRLETRKRDFVREFKNILKKHQRGFIGKFLKNHSFSSQMKESVWGLEEFLTVISEVAPTRTQRYDWKKLGTKEFLEMDYKPTIEKKIREILKKIEL
ncbi:hypothetical protein SAMN02745174_02429 [Cetobacterium ceti]|uniref:Uncharacterized protein n=1 Tax=Cetobacterium ceti TaxID=180163 RepID=A0A1T4QSC9_9FUSO|nr:hypothetical protein [Cetobacterium ceti]SKA06615.1 hypothetical protein SAMN02745174_02429 [Cetobacterium ceti]